MAVIPQGDDVQSDKEQILKLLFLDYTEGNITQSLCRKELTEFGVLSPTSEYMSPNFFDFFLKYVPIPTTLVAPHSLTSPAPFLPLSAFIHKKPSSGGLRHQSPKVTLLLERGLGSSHDSLCY